jgi:hypothetical protein
MGKAFLCIESKSDPRSNQCFAFQKRADRSRAEVVPVGFDTDAARNPDTGIEVPATSEQVALIKAEIQKWNGTLGGLNNRHVVALISGIAGHLHLTDPLLPLSTATVNNYMGALKRLHDDPSLLPTGSSQYAFARKEALRNFLVALRDAEDHPQRHYHIRLSLSEDTLTTVDVTSADMRTDPGIEQGDNACILLGEVVGEANSMAVEELVDDLCVLGIVAPGAVATAIGVGSATSPLIGVPAGWTVAVAGKGACWATSKFAGWTAGALAGNTTELFCTMLRAYPAREPGDPLTFNVKAPEPLPRPRPYSHMTEQERAWRQHRDAIEYLIQTHASRATAYARLSTSQIAERKRYAERVDLSSKKAFAFRADTASRYLAWADYQLNKIVRHDEQTAPAWSAIATQLDNLAADNRTLGNVSLSSAEAASRSSAYMAGEIARARGWKVLTPQERQTIFDRLSSGGQRVGAAGAGVGGPSDGSAVGNAPPNSHVTPRGGCDSTEGICVQTVRVLPNGDREYLGTDGDVWVGGRTTTRRRTVPSGRKQ